LQPHSVLGREKTVIVAGLRGTGELCTSLAEAKVSGLFCSKVDEIAKIAARKSAAAIIVDLDSILGPSDRATLKTLRSVSGATPIIGICEDEAARARALAQDYLKDRLFDQICTRPLDLEQLFASLQKNRLNPQREAKALNSTADDDLGIVGESAAIVAIRRAIRKMAATDVPVLITGESGTGKELAARAIHQLSSRHAAPFVAINCAGLPPGLIASELFGHERGAFTGAVARKLGRLEVANGGTSFLDEIGDFPLELQGHLLRFLQEKVIERVGSTASIRLDARIVAATHIDLKKAVEAGRFREDLFYRLNVLAIEMPPLRSRGDDIALLADRFARKFSREVNRPFDGLKAEATAALRGYDWPGNVRELIAVLQRAIVMAEGPWLSATDLGLSGVPVAGAARLPTLAQARNEAEAESIRRALILADANVCRAAKLLGISRNTLYRLAERHSIALRET
jgi:DNA-binding NtrC family response regulator